MLVYMNDDWGPDGGGPPPGALRRGDFEPYAAEVPPTMGTVFGFLRADNSWHGHRPFAGERKVVQIAWIATPRNSSARRSATGWPSSSRAYSGA